MAIKILKKRHVGEVRKPAPVLETEPRGDDLNRIPNPPNDNDTVVPRDRPQPIICTFCRHPYLEPCHGEKATCMNAVWKRERMKKD